MKKLELSLKLFAFLVVLVLGGASVTKAFG
jgi:hypothetical protein